MIWVLSFYYSLCARDQASYVSQSFQRFRVHSVDVDPPERLTSRMGASGRWSRRIRSATSIYHGQQSRPKLGAVWVAHFRCVMPWRVCASVSAAVTFWSCSGKCLQLHAVQAWGFPAFSCCLLACSSEGARLRLHLSCISSSCQFLWLTHCLFHCNYCHATE